jgi:AAA+ superfamily predicted ATPase
MGRTSRKKVAGLIREAHREKIKTGKAICIVFLDEIEGIAGDRSGSTITSRHDITLVDTLLQVIEEGKENGIIFIGATNHLDSVDPAIRRSGRLEPIEITFPDVQEQRELISYYTKVHFGIEPSDYFINYFIAKLNEKNQVSRADIMAGIRDFAIISSNISEDQLTSIQDCFPDLKNQDEVKRRNCYSKYLDMLLKFLTKSLHPCIKERIFNEGLKSIASQEFKITYYNDIFQKDYSRKQVKFCLQDCKFTQEELDELM